MSTGHFLRVVGNFESSGIYLDLVRSQSCAEERERELQSFWKSKFPVAINFESSKRRNKWAPYLIFIFMLPSKQRIGIKLCDIFVCILPEGALLGSYYTDQDFSTLQQSRLDASLDFDWGFFGPTLDNVFSIGVYIMRFFRAVRFLFSE